MRQSEHPARSRGALGFARTAVATLVVLVATLIPGSAVPSVGISHIDLLAHMLLFAAWSAAVSLDIGFLAARPWLMFGLALVFAVVTETLQLASPGRAFDLLDVAADAAGAGLGILLAAEWRRHRSSAMALPGHGG